EIPDHPLVNQTIDDCLAEAMDIAGLEEVLRRIERGEICCIARDLPEPSPLAGEILNARPYAFLDNAPLEERRTQAVYTRRASDRNSSDGLGVLDAAAIRELVRGRMEACGPITVGELADTLVLQRSETDAALLALEAEGFILRGKFHPQATEQEWCDRRLLARIHRLTIDRLRAEIHPVSVHDFYRFLFAWQRADREHRVEGPEGLQSVLEQLDGCELPLAAWESAVLPARVADYDPEWLDRLCFSGRVGWGRLSTPQNSNARASAPLRTSPIALYLRENLADWLALTLPNSAIEFSATSQAVFEALESGGALFFSELVSRTDKSVLPSQVEEAC